MAQEQALKEWSDLRDSVQIREATLHPPVEGSLLRGAQIVPPQPERKRVNQTCQLNNAAW